MCLIEEVQGSCWRGSRGVICVAVGGNGAVSVVVYTEQRYGNIVSERRLKSRCS